MCKYNILFREFDAIRMRNIDLYQQSNKPPYTSGSEDTQAELKPSSCFAQSAGAVEYTDCTSAEG